MLWQFDFLLNHFNCGTSIIGVAISQDEDSLLNIRSYGCIEGILQRSFHVCASHFRIKQFYVLDCFSLGLIVVLSHGVPKH